MQKFRRDRGVFFRQDGPVGDGPRGGATLIRARVLELVAGAWGMGGLIGDGVPGGELDEGWRMNFGPACFFKKICIGINNLYRNTVIHLRQT